MEVVKNDLESIFYAVREKFDYSEAYKSVSTEDRRKELLDLIATTETWAEDEITKDTELSTVKEKLAAIEKLWQPIKKRAIEFDTRAEFIIQMDKEIKKVEKI